MNSNELRKTFRTLPEADQNKILVDAYAQIDKAHRDGKALARFTWRDCELVDNNLVINTPASQPLNDDTRQQNLRDYAGVIYFLTTGKKDTESMGWDGGRLIKSAVLREIVLTICGRNLSVGPLVSKLQQPYVDEDTFFNGYTTVDEIEGTEAMHKEQDIKNERERQERQERQEQARRVVTPPRPWYLSWWWALLGALLFGGYHACQRMKQEERNKSYEQIYKYHSEQQESRRILNEASKNINGLPIRSNSHSTPSEGSNSIPSEGSHSTPSEGSPSTPSEGSNSTRSEGSN